MPTARPAPQVSAGGVRTPEGGPVLGSRLCPVCLKNPLQGEQTACSAACRRERSRERERGILRDGLLLIRAQVDGLLARVERRR
jgi:predicted nucleic acid-binding Zn ribbon protein